MDASSRRDRTVERALREALSGLSVTPGGWRFALSNGIALEGHARIADDWLEIAARAPAARPIERASAWPLLLANATLDGAARWTLAGAGGFARLQADLFTGDELDVRGGGLAGRVAALCETLRSAARDGNGRERASPSLCDDAALSPESADRLGRFCAEAGWVCTRRESGMVTVRIEARAAAYQARLALSDEGALRVVVPVIESAALARASRAAIARLLLRASASIRLVKGFASRAAGPGVAGLAAATDTPQSAADVDRMLSALTVGCDLVGRELQALTHEPLARAYLEMMSIPEQEEEREEESPCRPQP